MKKNFYVLLFSLGFPLATFAMDHDGSNALQLLRENYVRPEFFGQQVSSKNYERSVNTYLRYIATNRIANNARFATIKKDSDALQHLKMQVPLAQNALENRQRSHFWKMFRRSCYALGGIYLVARGIGISVDSLSVQDGAPGTLVGGMFVGLGATASVLAALSGKEHWSQYQDTKWLKTQYQEHVATPLNSREDVD